jgi:hypothetical protein
MTTEQLRQVAERLTYAADGVNALLGAPRHRGPIEDAADLARAWLSDHPADDDEPVTAEWLKRAGFVSEDPECPYYWIALYPDLNPAFTVELVEGSTRHVGWIGDPNDRRGWPWDICSRRQVRDICRALRATLTERAK